MLESTLDHPCRICPALFSSSWAGDPVWYQCIPLPFLIYLCFEWRSCKRDKLPMMPCVCARVRGGGHTLGPWLDLLPAEQQHLSQCFICSSGLNFCDKTECKEYGRRRKGEQVDPTHSLQPITLLFLLDSVKIEAWENSVSDYFCNLQTQGQSVNDTASKPWAWSNSMRGWLNSVSCPQHPNLLVQKLSLLYM